MSPSARRKLSSPVLPSWEEWEGGIEGNIPEDDEESLVVAFLDPVSFEGDSLIFL